MGNRLSREKSPYLREHAENPVDWYGWGAEALERARREDRPLFISIGYHACHWCHVMERESFRDEATAAAMNRAFVCVKVDREERPDLDDVYQRAVALLGRPGGWPLTVFATPAGVPFFGGTYFPPEDRGGLPSLRRVLAAVEESWRTRRAEIERVGREILADLGPAAAATTEIVSPALWRRVAGGLLAFVDREHGGFGAAPKFPCAPALEVLWRAATQDGLAGAEPAVRRALRAMADGGIHDQLGGGFHRYAIDERWSVPHFEKMLYDNALLAPLYLRVSLETGEARFRETAEDVLAWMAREMLSPGGGFLTSQDADSEGEEGKFFVWSPAEIAAVLGDAERAAALCRHLGIGAARVPVRASPSTPALAEGRRRLFAAREKRVHPARDEKILAGWNGLAVSALARAAGALDDESLLARARAAIRFVETRLTDGEGRLLRYWLDGPGSVLAFAEDYASLAVASLDLYEAAGETGDLDRAARLATVLLDRFFLAEEGAVAITTAGGEGLPVRSLALMDGPVPSATALAAQAWQRLGWLTGGARFRDAAATVIRRRAASAAESPFAFAGLACALDGYLRGPVEVVVVGPREDQRTWSLVLAARTVDLPNRALVRIEPGSGPASLDPELWVGREDTPEPTAFVCRGGSCLAPITNPARLPAALREARSAP